MSKRVLPAGGEVNAQPCGDHADEVFITTECRISQCDACDKGEVPPSRDGVTVLSCAHPRHEELRRELLLASLR